MKSQTSIGLMLVLLTMVTDLPGVHAPVLAGDDTPAASVVVSLLGGRTLTGELASQTDAQSLWLDTGRSGVTIRRPIQWDQVVKVSVLGEEFSGDELHQIATKIREYVPVPTTRPARMINTVASPKGTVPFSSNESWDSPRPSAASRVCYLAVDVEVANWNETVEVDGLRVHVYPMNANGQIVPVHGTLEVDLTGRQLAVARPSQPQPFSNLGRWTQTVRPGDFGPRGAVYRLPFQSFHPEFDLTGAPIGTVHTQLCVPGNGTFDATRSDVRIRPASAMRDDLQRSSGQRFYSNERTGTGRQATSSR